MDRQGGNVLVLFTQFCGQKRWGEFLGIYQRYDVLVQEQIDLNTGVTGIVSLIAGAIGVQKVRFRVQKIGPDDYYL